MPGIICAMFACLSYPTAKRVLKKQAGPVAARLIGESMGFVASHPRVTGHAAGASDHRPERSRRPATAEGAGQASGKAESSNSTVAERDLLQQEDARLAERYTERHWSRQRIRGEIQRLEAQISQGQQDASSF